MNFYRVEMKLKKTGTIKLNDVRSVIESCIIEYNASAVKARNAKKVALKFTYPQIMVVVLESELILENPSKALASLSRKLLKAIPDLDSSVVGTSLFESEFTIEKQETSIPKKPNHAEALKLLVDLFVTVEDKTVRKIQTDVQNEIVEKLLQYEDYKNHRYEEIEDNIEIEDEDDLKGARCDDDTLFPNDKDGSEREHFMESKI